MINDVKIGDIAIINKGKVLQNRDSQEALILTPNSIYKSKGPII